MKTLSILIVAMLLVPISAIYAQDQEDSSGSVSIVQGHIVQTDAPPVLIRSCDQPVRDTVKKGVDRVVYRAGQARVLTRRVVDRTVDRTRNVVDRSRTVTRRVGVGVINRITDRVLTFRSRFGR